MINMHSELCEAYFDILERVKDIEYYDKEVEHDDVRIEELHIVRDADNKPTSIRALMLYNQGY